MKNLKDRHERVIEVFSTYGQNYNFEKILDVGCGGGAFSLILKQELNARELYGIDISEERVRLANSNGVQAFQRDTDCEDFPFEDNFFDAVFALEHIEHLYNPDHALDEVYRVLKPEGFFVLSTPNLASIYNRIALLLGFQPFATTVSLRYNVGRPFEFQKTPRPDIHPRIHAHARVFTLKSLKILLRLHSFEIISLKGSPASAEARRIRLFKILDDLFKMLPSLSEGVICVCREKETFQ